MPIGEGIGTELHSRHPPPVNSRWFPRGEDKLTAGTSFLTDVLLPQGSEIVPDHGRFPLYRRDMLAHFL